MRIETLREDDAPAVEACAHLLVDGFQLHWPEAWPTIESARQELAAAFEPGKAAFVARGENGDVAGWVGGIPTYDGRVWEIHPLVVGEGYQRRGVARGLIAALEDHARRAGALTLWVGTDDEANLTSLGGVDLFPGILDKLREIRDVAGHPFAMYQRLGFEVSGVVPDANGPGKPDILMARRLR